MVVIVAEKKLMSVFFFTPMSRHNVFYSMNRRKDMFGGFLPCLIALNVL